MDLTQADVAFIQSSGRDPRQIAAQLEMLTGKWKSVRILRPATLHDGIQKFQAYDLAVLRNLHEKAAAEGRVSSFVPASGSGTRLFQSLLTLHREQDTDFDHVRWRAARGDEAAKDALIVLENIRDFAIWPELQRRGCSPDSLEQIFQTLLAETFGDTGLRCPELPKGLIPFHRYDGGIRTAFSEHLREAAALCTDAKGRCRIHFTVADSHQTLFEREWRREQPHLERDLRTRFQVDFSVQSPQTDTVAVDSKGNILRDRSGHIAFRPGGHGALLPNLAGCAGDIVLVKNIDNIAREEAREEIVRVRQLICGLLLSVESEVHHAIRELRQGSDPRPAIQLLDARFGMIPVKPLSTDEALRDYALAELNRPIRACGIVGSLDHTGGRPFWVDTDERDATLQIVESAEINMTDPRTRRLFKRSRYFNPVDLACSILDVDGLPFKLEEFTISSTAIIARKVIAGEPSLVYEHPGLWNGSMGLWNTVFVEVPDSVFNPVKSLSDLWASGHLATATG